MKRLLLTLVTLISSTPAIANVWDKLYEVVTNDITVISAPLDGPYGIYNPQADLIIMNSSITDNDLWWKVFRHEVVHRIQDCNAGKDNKHLQSLKPMSYYLDEISKKDHDKYYSDFLALYDHMWQWDEELEAEFKAWNTSGNEFIRLYKQHCHTTENESADQKRNTSIKPKLRPEPVDTRQCVESPSGRVTTVKDHVSKHKYRYLEAGQKYYKTAKVAGYIRIETHSGVFMGWIKANKVREC